MVIANGFKVLSVVLYGNYSQINGEFIRSIDNLPGINNAFSFNASLEEGRALTPDVVYDFTLTPQTEE